MTRRRKNPETHDNRVRREAAKLNSERWNIQADLPGYESPDPIGKDNRVPDILATKGNKVKIIEVETPDTVDSHTFGHRCRRIILEVFHDLIQKIHHWIETKTKTVTEILGSLFKRLLYA